MEDTRKKEKKEKKSRSAGFVEVLDAVCLLAAHRANIAGRAAPGAFVGL